MITSEELFHDLKFENTGLENYTLREVLKYIFEKYYLLEKDSVKDMLEYHKSRKSELMEEMKEKNEPNELSIKWHQDKIHYLEVMFM